MANFVRLTSKTKKYRKALSEDNLKQIARAGGMVIRNKAQVNAPYKTGDLRDSIHVEDEESSATKATVKVGTNLVYAARQEYGFRDVDSLGRKYNDPGRPYLRPAFDTEKGNALRAMKLAATALLRRV